MSFKRTPPSVTGSLADLFKLFEHCSPEGLREKVITETLQGLSEDIIPPFRIPAADIDAEIFFNDIFLLCRFTNLILSDQEIFLKAVRQAFKDNQASSLYLNIQWNSPSSSKTRTLKIDLLSYGHLNFHLYE